MDDISTSTLLIVLALLIIASAYFSSSETGMMSINRYRLKHLVKEKHKGAMRVNKLLKRPDRLIGLILIGNNLVNLAAASIATIVCTRYFHELGPVVATIGLTFIILIFAEVTPKTLAALYPEKIAFPSSALLKPLQLVLYPFITMINFITNGLLKLFGIQSIENDKNPLSKEELRSVVNEASSLMSDQYQDMLLGILDLDKVTAEDIMIPRSDIMAIDINDEWRSIQKQLTHAQHTRVLLYRDTIDDAVGFIHLRDALRLLSKDQFSKATLLRAVREIYFTPESTKLSSLLFQFQTSKERIGLVVDEYGDIQGLVTLEDILEEIVGEFTTSILPSHSKNSHTQQDGSVLVDGSANIRELNKEMSWELPTEGPKTLNGLVLEHLEEIPHANMSFRIAGYPMEIVDIKDNMIRTVRILPEFYEKKSNW